MSERFIRTAIASLLAALVALAAPACDTADATRPEEANANANDNANVGAVTQRDGGQTKADENETSNDQRDKDGDTRGPDDSESASDADDDKNNKTDTDTDAADDSDADTDSADDESTDDKTTDADSADPPPALTHYKGREIATTMHYLGAPWLTRESREREEDSKTMLKQLGLKPGMAVCDMGCGNGFYTLPIAEAVGEKGKVFAVDIQVQMLRYLRKRAEKQKIDNIEYILGDLHDPKLPANSCDLILLVDVYHEFSHPVHMLEAMRKALKKDGQIVLVEFRAEDPNVPIKPLHKMSKKQILKELEANGYKLSKSFDKLPWQHMMFFKRESPAPKAEEEK